MRVFRTLMVIALVSSPGFAAAELSGDDIPAGSTWYFHADLGEMRSTEGGRELYGWIEREILDDVHEETGLDVSREIDRITAFSAMPEGAVIVAEGAISQDSKDKLLAFAFAADDFRTLTHGKQTYYFVEGDRSGDEVEVDAFEDGAYFSFALDDRIVVTSTSEQMKEMLDNGGRVVPANPGSGTLFVLTAEKSLIQAGLDAGELESEDDGEWDSKILRNTEEIAVMVSDVAGKLAVETRLVAKQAEMAQSLASVVRGLVSLIALSDDMDPAIADVLRSTKVDVDGATLKISLAFDPAIVVAALDE